MRGVCGEVRLEGSGKWVATKVKFGLVTAVDAGGVKGNASEGIASDGRGKKRMMPRGNWEGRRDFPKDLGVRIYDRVGACHVL